MANKYAVVMTARGLLLGANAFINGLDYYDNEVDFYLIGNEAEKKYVDDAKQIKGLKVNLNFVHINDLKIKFPPPSQKRMGWHVRFYRYKVAQDVGKNYDAILIVDADMLCMNNIMKYFKLAHDTGFLVLPNNSWGSTVEKVEEIGIDFLQGASSPPFHNMPLFIDANKYNNFLNKVWDWGTKEDWGDMVQVSRTIFRENLVDRVFPLSNLHWVVSSHYFEAIKRTIRGGKQYLLVGEEKINMIHRRWWMKCVCEKFVHEIKEKDNFARGQNNIKIFWEEYQRFNTKHKIKIDVPSEKLDLACKI